MQHFAVIVAGGRGKRMKEPTPKQFMMLDNIPVLMRTLHAFDQSAFKPELIVVLATDLQQEWMDLCYRYHFHVPHTVVDGGNTRFESVRNGLHWIENNRLKTTGYGGQETGPIDPHHPIEGDALIAVHDGARPLIQPQWIDLSFREAARLGAVTLGIPSTDSIRQVDPVHRDRSKMLPREQIFRIQTPQTFRASILIRAYENADRTDFNDDAAVVERMGIPITVVDGDPQNIKITHREDLITASAWLRDANR